MIFILDHDLVHDLHDVPNIDHVVEVIIDGRIAGRYFHQIRLFLLTDHDLDHVQHRGNSFPRHPHRSFIPFILDQNEILVMKMAIVNIDKTKTKKTSHMFDNERKTIPLPIKRRSNFFCLIVLQLYLYIESF